MMMNSGGGGWMMRGQQGDIDEEGMRLYDQRVVIRLLKYMLPYKMEVFLSMLGVIVYTLATVAIPAIIAIGIDRYVNNGDLSGLNNLAIIFAAVLVVHYISNYSHQLILARVSQRIIYDLRNDVFHHLQNLPMSFHNRHKVGSLMSRAQNDIYQLQEFLDIVVLSIADLLSLGGIFAIMVVTDWELSLFAFASLPVLILIIYVWQAHARPAFLRVRVAISNVNASLAENLDGVRVVQSMSRQKKNLVAFEQLNQRHLDTNLRAQRLSSSLMPAVEMFMSFGLATTIVFGGRLVLSSALGVGQLIQFTLYIQRFFDPIRSLTQQFTQLQRAMASGARIFDLLDAEADLFDAPDAQDMPRIQGAIHYENVSFAYEPGKPVLSNIDLDIEPGQTVALVGRTGAGKTTMAALISRFYDVTDGSLTIDGHDVRSVTRQSLAQQMGIVLQEPFQFSGSIMDNIRYKPSRGRRREGVRGGEGRRPARPYPEPAGWLPDGDGRARRQHEPGSTPAHQLRPRARGRPPHHRAGRGNRQRGHPDRAAYSGGHRPPASRAHCHRHCAPALDNQERRQDHRHGQGAHRRDWQPRRTRRTGWTLREAVRTARAVSLDGHEAGVRPRQRIRRRNRNIACVATNAPHPGP